MASYFTHISNFDLVSGGLGNFSNGSSMSYPFTGEAYLSQYSGNSRGGRNDDSRSEGLLIAEPRRVVSQKTDEAHS